MYKTPAKKDNQLNIIFTKILKIKKRETSVSLFYYKANMDYWKFIFSGILKR